MQRSLTLTQKQHRITLSRKRKLFFVGGIGSGKSFVGAFWVLRWACLAGSLGFITAPVIDTVNNSTLPALKHAWSEVGIYEGEHYVVGTRPPEHWKVKPYTNRNSKIITWRWSSYTVIDGSKEYDKQRGVEFDYIYIDEYRDVEEKAYEVYEGRLRGKAVKKHLADGGIEYDYQILATTTPPEDVTLITRHAGSDTEIVYSTSYENARNLPTGYIDKLKASYDPLTFDREVMGRLINMRGKTAYYAFDVAHNVVERELDPNAPLYLCWDFNASQVKPMSTIAVQEHDGKIYVVEEFIVRDSNTTQQSELVKEWLDDKEFKGELIITGDYSGMRKESNATRNDYAIIREFLEHHRNFKIRTRPTLSVRDRVASLNALFCNAKKERRMYVSPRCKYLIEDLSKVRWKDSGIVLDDKNPAETHATDAVSYFAYNFYDISRRKAVTHTSS